MSLKTLRQSLIPFSFYKKKSDNANSPTWISGYIIVKKEADGVEKSLLYAFDGNSTFTNEPFAKYPYKALSATANHDRPGTLTVHFKTQDNGNITSELSFESQKWTDISTSGTFNEIVWIN